MDLTAREQSGRLWLSHHLRLYRRVCDALVTRWPSAPEPDQFCAARHMLVSFGSVYGFIDESLASPMEQQVVLTVNQFFTAGRVVANPTC
jgi:hypothetical protein